MGAPLSQPESYRDELDHILALRRRVYRLSGMEWVFFLVGWLACLVLGSWGVVVFLALIIPIVLRWYRRLKTAAHYPCPRCGEPFGTASSIVIFWGAEVCQSCSLSIHTAP